MYILAYTYNADVHCISCVVAQYHYTTQTAIHWPFETTHPASDINGIHVNQTDNEGNLVYPLFVFDDWQEFDPSFLAEHPTQYLTCGDCSEIIDTYIS